MTTQAMDISSRNTHAVGSTKLGDIDSKLRNISSGTVLHEHDGHNTEHGGLYNQKSFKLRDHARAASPTGSVRSSYSTRRHSSRRFSGGFSRSLSHRSEMSRELVAQGESEFFSLMELMTNISRKSSSLKEVWTKLISERESYMLEMDRMQEQFEEFTEIIERKDKERHQHTHDHDDRKQEISELRLEISAALASVTENRKKLHDRDTELINVRHELEEYKDICARLREDHVDSQSSIEELRSKLTVSEAERDKTRAEVDKYAFDLRTINQKHSEMQRSYRELNNKHESTKAELVALTLSHSNLKKERHDLFREKGEIAESLRKSNHKCDEYSHKLREMTERHESKTLELQKSKEFVSKLGLEKDELHHRAEEWKRQLNETHSKWESAEDSCGKLKLKLEHSDREVISVREELKFHELEKTQLQETITKNREEIRLLTAEKKRVSEDYYQECKQSEEHHRETLVLQESLRRLESQFKEKTDVVHQLTERAKRLETERYEATRKSGDLSIENEQLQASITSLKAELVTINGRYAGVAEKLRECETKYEEVCESMTEFQEGHSEFEYEISILRTMLREAREQKEKSISARNSADHERDEAIARYEEKCRELERFEEEMSQHLHSQGGSESRRTTVTRYRQTSGNGVDGHSNHGD